MKLEMKDHAPSSFYCLNDFYKYIKEIIEHDRNEILLDSFYLQINAVLFLNKSDHIMIDGNIKRKCLAIVFQKYVFECIIFALSKFYFQELKCKQSNT